MKRIIIILAALVSIGGGYYWWTTRSDAEIISFAAKAPDARIIGSGTIEAETVAVSAENGGRIVAIYAGEGDAVDRGDLLVELDPSLLQARQNQLEAALSTARANLAEVSAPTRPEAVAASAAKLQQAQAARDGAEAVWQEAQAIVANPLELNARITAARGQIAVLEKQVEAAQAAMKAAEIQRDEAARNQSNDEAVTRSRAAEKQVEAARANLSAAEAELSGARRQLNLIIAVKNNPLALIAQTNAAESAYKLSEAAAAAAEANLTAVKAGPMPEEVAIAQARMQQAEAALVSLQVQLDRLNITAPSDAIVVSRAANPGELAAPGAPLLNLGDLDRVTLKVFIPETQIGRVKVGQIALVSVDAYPNETFEGIVTFIASEAEFTPRNVQTQEERVNMVFAAKISLDNPDRRLKPGMPAEAEILTNAQASAAAAPSPSPSPQATLTATAMPTPTDVPPATPTPAATEATPTIAPTPAEAASPIRAEIITGGLNARSGPGVAYPVITILEQGDIVPVINIDLKTGWLQVQLPGDEQSGWISGQPAFVAITSQP